MKYFFLFFWLFIILFSCKKESHQNLDTKIDLLSKIKSQLKDSIPSIDFKELVFNHSVITNIEQNNLSILQIPF